MTQTLDEQIAFAKRMYDVAIGHPEAWTIDEAAMFASVLATLRDAKAREAQAKADAEDAARYRYLRDIPIPEAQAFFWNYSSRKERNKAIDAARGAAMDDLARMQKEKA